MRVLVTGATGFVGRRLIDRLVASGHSCAALSRNPTRARSALPALSAAHAWEPAAGLPPREALEGVEGIVHLAGETVVGRWTRRKRKAILESRVLGTRNLVAALGALEPDARPGCLVSASAIGYYGDRGDLPLVEAEAPGSDFLSEVCQGWEAEARRAEDLGLRVVRPRIGLVLDPAGGALAAMLRPFRLGLGGPLGSGRQWWSWIHLDDLLSIFQQALASDLQGAVNATAPHPVRQVEFARSLGRSLGRPAFLPGPAAALKLALGGFSAELLASRRVIPELLSECGFTFSYPQLDGALSALLQPA